MAATTSVFVANLFVTSTLACVPPSFEKILSLYVWLLKDGVAWVVPFTLVDRKDAAQLSTHFPVDASAMVPAFLEMERASSFTSFLQAPKMAMETRTTARAAILCA